MTTITDEQVEQYMRDKLAEAHQRFDYAALYIQINAFRDSPHKEPEFSCYSSGHDERIYGKSLTEAIAKRVAIPPKDTAGLLRKQAAELIAEAEALESKI